MRRVSVKGRVQGVIGYIESRRNLSAKKATAHHIERAMKKPFGKVIGKQNMSNDAEVLRLMGKKIFKNWKREVRFGKKTKVGRLELEKAQLAVKKALREHPRMANNPEFRKLAAELNKGLSEARDAEHLLASKELAYTNEKTRARYFRLKRFKRYGKPSKKVKTWR